MRYGHVPFGYRIHNGKAVIYRDEAEKIRNAYSLYLSGCGYEETARKAELNMPATSLKMLLQNRHYPGDDFYPKIIDRQIFDDVEKERLRRCEMLGRLNMPKREKWVGSIASRFKLAPIKEKIKDPFVQAAYVYSQIEREV